MFQSDLTVLQCNGDNNVCSTINAWWEEGEENHVQPVLTNLVLLTIAEIVNCTIGFVTWQH